eukprot:2733606-Amphidinium_carterae.1
MDPCGPGGVAPFPSLSRRHGLAAVWCAVDTVKLDKVSRERHLHRLTRNGRQAPDGLLWPANHTLYPGGMGLK